METNVRAPKEKLVALVGVQDLVVIDSGDALLVIPRDRAQDGRAHDEVEQTPAEVIAGHDPQLEKAIEVVMEQLKENPPEEPVRPPYPIRVRQ